LSEDNKNVRRDAALTLLSKFRKKDFLYKIITGDEKWIFYDNPKRRKSWIDFGQSLTSTPKANIHKKILLCIWWDWKGVLYYELLQPGEIITEDRYQQQLTNLSDALEEKRLFTGQRRRKVILLHNINARSHVAKVTQDHIFAVGWELLLHAAYSPDMAPSDCYLFRSLQHHLADTHFVRFGEIQKCIDDFIASKPVSFYRQGIRKLLERWQKIVVQTGNISLINNFLFVFV